MTEAEILRRARQLRLNRAPRPSFVTVTEQQARDQGFFCITSGYALRQYEQCQALERALADLQGVDHLLVQVKNHIFIWRKKNASTITSTR